VPIEFSPTEISHYYSIRVPTLRRTHTKQWRGPCPVHQGDRDSFSVDSTTGMATCHSTCGKGWDILSLEQELTGKEFVAAKSEIFSMLGRKEDPEIFGVKVKKKQGILDRIYPYCDLEGKVIYEVVRYKDPKGFKQRVPLGNGEYRYSLGNLERLPYRLPEIHDKQFLLLAEGEKTVDCLVAHGLNATCNSEGAGKFHEYLAKWFVGKDLAILGDNDDPGRDHAQQQAERLFPVAKSVKIVEIPNLPQKGDAVDFFESGGTVDGLRAFYQNAPFWDPSMKIDPEDRHLSTPRIKFDTLGLRSIFDFSLQKGAPTPFSGITRMLGGGLLDQEVYIIGGNSGSGKSSLAIQFSISALKSGVGVLYFSMEMSDLRIIQRMTSIEARVDLNRYQELQEEEKKTGKQVSEELHEMNQKLSSQYMRMVDSPIYVSQKARVTPDYLVNETKRLKGKHPNIGLVVVDHVQLMSPDKERGSEYESVQSVSRSLKQVAVEARVPLLVVSQTSRYHSKEKRDLEIWDLRGAGIEEDAAAVMLLYEDREDARTADAEGRYQSGPVKTWLKIGKSRYGSGGKISLLHHKKWTRFDLEEFHRSPAAPRRTNGVDHWSEKMEMEEGEIN